MFCRVPLCRLLALILCLSILFGFAVASGEEVIPYPTALLVRFIREEWKADDGRACTVPVPDTYHAEVNRMLRSAQEEIWQDITTNSPADTKLQMEATYRISGTKWAGFLMIGRVLTELDDDSLNYEVENTTYLSYRMLTFDMETGKPITLSDVFPADSPAWDTIGALVDARLNAFYPQLDKDQSQVDALCTYEALKEQPFLPSAGRLTITMPLWTVQEGKWQLANTFLPYPDFRQWMNEEAQEQTDNSHRPIIAITYDDGPMRQSTERILNALNDNGASATFFCIGRSVEMWPDIIRRELDACHTVGSHTYKHKYDYQVDAQYLMDDREHCLQLHRDLTGLEPELFRAPGGNWEKYVEKEIGWPIILWRFSAGDTGNNNAWKIADRIFYNARNGDIILMHDIKDKTAKGSEMFLSRLAEAGFLFATVDELLYLHGIDPQPNTVYFDAFTPPVTEK